MDSSEMQRQWLISDKLCHVWDMSAWLVDLTFSFSRTIRDLLLNLLSRGMCPREGWWRRKFRVLWSPSYRTFANSPFRASWNSLSHLSSRSCKNSFDPSIVDTLLTTYVSGISFFRDHAFRANVESSFSLDFGSTKKSTVRFKEKKNDESGADTTGTTCNNSFFHDQSLNRDPQSNHEIQVRTAYDPKRHRRILKDEW